MCPECGHTVGVHSFGPENGYSLDISDFHVVFVISDSRCRGHLWDVWPPVGSEKTETSYLAAFVGGVVILSIWLIGAIPATILIYFTRARLQASREHRDLA